MYKKSKKWILAIIPVVLVLLVVSTNVFAFDQFTTDKINSALSGSEASGNASGAIKSVWGTVLLILQILAVAAIIIAGIRYMFASADAKADIKKQTIGLMVGAVLVFGASSIINLIISITSDVTGGGTTVNNPPTQVEEQTNPTNNDSENSLDKIA